jgi:hypothetical protein
LEFGNEKKKRTKCNRYLKAIKKQRVLKENNITLIAAISPVHGLIHYETHESTKNEPGERASRFNIFIKKLCNTPSLKTTSFFLIVDNSIVHNRDEIEYILSRKSTNTRRHDLTYLPPYSPMRTPIEKKYICYLEEKY